MKTPIYKSYEDLPLYLNAETISKALGIAISSAYELMQEKDFPTFKVGSFEKTRRIRLQTRKIGGLTAVLRLVRK